MPTDSLLEVALFPIPNMVSFPGTTVPLHVFEPRYRALIRDCIRDKRMVGVCHTARQISDTKNNLSVSEVLSSNQASFEPCDIFSAGFCQIVETTDDGRLRVDIEMNGRYRRVDELQLVPYKVVSCENIPDTTMDQEKTTNATHLMQTVHKILTSILASQNPDAEKHLDLASWLDLTPADYSFQVFSVFRFEGDFMQTILETRDPLKRLQRISKIFSATEHPPSDT